METVPLKIRVDIRDQWDPPKSSVQNAAEQLTGTLGHKVIPQADWPSLWEQLKDSFPEKATFIPTIVRYTLSWYERLLLRLDNEESPEWTEELLSTLASASKGANLHLQIEPSGPPHERPHTSWRTSTQDFYLGIPKGDPTIPASVVSGLDSDFEKMFNAPDGTPSRDEGWSTVSVADSQAPPPPQFVPSQAPSSGHPSVVPTGRLAGVGSLARPPDLFTLTTPYILIIDAGSNPFLVQSSHQGSLELMSSYLNKWGKPNTNDSLRRTIYKVELIESGFFYGVKDALTIEPHITFRGYAAINPTIVIAFVEGVLGYKLVHTTGSRWVYRCDSILR
ncbi:hypothetical protein BDN72DRAFT_834752 [Pluteus cervinus]|uniref:Uncharacterized protein n=1 Tax=Pluteus cervinus TaxID=181527 RepID=A0ACD3B6T4_9AGAR|nr:hypothetical protein BDN72DRAFT_834752 [Pluteus cervinus]